MCISPAFLCPAKCTDSIHYILSHSLIHPQRFFFHQINFCGHFSIYLRNVLPFQYLSYFFPDDLLHHWPEHIRFHDLRHTFATLSLKSGVDVKTLSGALGHYSAGFTLNTYTHATAQMRQDAADTIGGVISQQVR